MRRFSCLEHFLNQGGKLAPSGQIYCVFLWIKLYWNTNSQILLCTVVCGSFHVVTEEWPTHYSDHVGRKARTFTIKPLAGEKSTNSWSKQFLILNSLIFRNSNVIEFTYLFKMKYIIEQMNTPCACQMYLLKQSYVSTVFGIKQSCH